MNPTVMLPPRIRGTLYLIYGVLTVASGAAVVGFATAEVAQPAWFKVTGAVLLFLGGAFGLTAASNTPNAPSSQLSPNTPPTDGDEGDGDDAGEQPAG